MPEDTIAAQATPAGRGGIAIVRISGPRALEFLLALFTTAECRLLESHRLYYGHLVHNGEMIDECMAVYMRAPRSYTREDVAELHLHGGDYVSARALDALFTLGARPAEPGEFTRRAFLNGRIDLSRAEAVMGLINASGEQAARTALRLLSGGTSAFVRDAQRRLLDFLAGVAAAIDYPEEVDENEAARDIAAKAEELAGVLLGACDERAARLLDTGMEVAICGRPNVGKSSLLNALLMEERAIVTPIPGTTRDVVRGSVILGGLRVNLSDTAGIRKSDEPVEKIGIERALAAMAGADVTLIALDGSVPQTGEDEALLARARAFPHEIILCKGDLPPAFDYPGALRVSAVTGSGLERLRALLLSRAGNPAESRLTLARHMRLARAAAASLLGAAAALSQGMPLDIAAIDLHDALSALGQITGDQVDERLLDQIFDKFCVGK
jgi:tRNA modification GTPase